jgi:hypothetical protein
LRLLWTFRHFHVLPQQILSRRDQHLIEKLSRSAVITPAGTVPRSAVLGVVEKPRVKPMAAAPHVVTMPTERKAPQTMPAAGFVPGLPTPGQHQRLFFERPGAKKTAPAAKSEKQRERGVPFRQWGAVGWLTAICLLVVVAKSFVASPPSKIAQVTKPVVPSAPVTQSAVRALPPVAPLPIVAKPKHRLAPAPPPSVTTFALKETSVAAARQFVSELPQGHFASPVAADPNEVGELHLKALIAADGSVKDVSVVSGDPKLAQAGIRAVRRWHYNPYEASATQAERETLINMKFFGQDAVSVTSVAR